MGYLIYFSGVVVCLFCSIFFIHEGYNKKTVYRKQRMLTILLSLFSWVTVAALIILTIAALIVNLFFKSIDKLYIELDKAYGNEV